MKSSLKSVAFLLFLILSSPLYSQSYYNRLFTDTAYQDFHSIVNVASGGYIALGSTTSAGVGFSDMLVVRLNEDGTIRWKQTYGSGADDYGMSIAESPLGGFVIMGNSNGFNMSTADDILLIRIDTSGTVLWSRTYGGMAEDKGNQVRVSSNGEICVAGMTQSFGSAIESALALITDDNGDIYWMTTYDQNPYNYFNGVLPTSDGGFLFTGATTRQDTINYDGFAVKTDLNGSVIWAKRIAGDSTDILDHSAEDPDNNIYIVTGTSGSGTNGGADAWICGLDLLTGGTVGAGYVGGPGDDRCYDIFPLATGQYLLSGYITEQGFKQHFLASINPLTIQLVWAGTDGDPLADNQSYAAIITPAADVIQAGVSFGYNHTAGQAQLLKSLAGSSIGCNSTVIQPGISAGILPDSMGTNVNPLILLPVDVSVFTTTPFLTDFLLCVPAGVNELSNNAEIKVFPDPASDFIKADFGTADRYTLQVRDGSGRICIAVNNYLRNQALDVRKLAPGFYTLEMTSAGKFAATHFIISR